jgi:hypothetical protein
MSQLLSEAGDGLFYDLLYLARKTGNLGYCLQVKGTRVHGAIEYEILVPAVGFKHRCRLVSEGLYFARTYAVPEALRLLGLKATGDLDQVTDAEGLREGSLDAENADRPAGNAGDSA